MLAPAILALGALIVLVAGFPGGVTLSMHLNDQTLRSVTYLVAGLSGLITAVTA